MNRPVGLYITFIMIVCVYFGVNSKIVYLVQTDTLKNTFVSVGEIGTISLFNPCCTSASLLFLYSTFLFPII